MGNKTLPEGKVDSELLAELLDGLEFDSSVRVVPGIGNDSAVVRTSDRYLAVATDPITFATDRPGTYSLAVNINDVVCQGCGPRWYTVSMMLPVGTTEKQLREIWDDLRNSLEQYDISAVSGHTEVTDAVTRPLLAGQVMGTPVEDRYLEPSNATAGDGIYHWRASGLEGAALIAREFPETVVEHAGEEARDRWAGLLDDPGICIWPEARRFVTDPAVIGLHDPTEGGVATALQEVADAAGTGLEIDPSSIQFPDHFESFCRDREVDPIGVLSSGSLLILVQEDRADEFESRHGKIVSRLGTMIEARTRSMMEPKGSDRDLPRYPQDQFIKLTKKLS